MLQAHSLRRVCLSEANPLYYLRPQAHFRRADNRAFAPAVTTTTIFRTLSIAKRFYSAHLPPTDPPCLITLKADLKQAMRTKDTLRLSVIKDILSQITNASKSPRPAPTSSSASSPTTTTLTDSHIYSLIRASIKSRTESAASYETHNRPDLASTETAEAQILTSYMPPQMDPRALQSLVIDVASRLGAGQKDIGPVLKELATLVDESVAPKALQAQIVRQVLGGASSRNVAQKS